MTEVGLFEAMYTARALRRLKPDPVPDELITQVLDAAIRAPSGGNAQNWIFIVVRDEAQRRGLGAVYRKVGRGRLNLCRPRSPGAFVGRAVSAIDGGRGIPLEHLLKHPFSSSLA
jgi:nitroreductase